MQASIVLEKRTNIIREVAHFKHENNISAVLQDRIDHVRERAAKLAAQKGVDEETVRQMYALLIKFSCDLEEEMMAQMKDDAAKQANGA